MQLDTRTGRIVGAGHRDDRLRTEVTAAGCGAREVGQVLSGVQGMIGETALVTKAIAGAHHPGSVRARGEEWLAIPLDPASKIEPGTNVVVADIERGLLVVFPTDTA